MRSNVIDLNTKFKRERVPKNIIPRQTTKVAPNWRNYSAVDKTYEFERDLQN